MTRKHAALRAIELLSGDKENREICEALEKIARGKLTNDWNKELVLESIEDFIEEHGYYPTGKEMDSDPMMPAHASAYLAMGMPSANEFTRRRPAGEVTALTWAKRTGCDTWTDLLIKSGFEKCIRTPCNHHPELTATISESELSVEEYEKMEEQLLRLLA